MAEGLKIVVTGDIKQAQTAMKQLVSDAEKSGSKAGQALGKGLDKATTSIKNIPKAAIPAEQAVSKLGRTVEALQFAIADRKAELIRTTDITRVAQLNGQIKDLEGELLRLKNAGTAGFDDLGNAVQKTGGAFSGVVNAGQGAFSVLRKIAFIVPGIGIAGLVGALSDLVIGLFKSKEGLDETAVSAAKFATAIKDAEEGVKQFVDSLDFGAEIKKLQNELQFGKGPKLDLLNFEVDKAKNDKIIAEANASITQLTDKILAIRRDAQFTLSKKGAQLLDTFFNDLEIPDNLIDDLDRKSKEVIRQIKVDATTIKALEEARLKATQENQKGELESRIKFKEDLKKIKPEKFEFDRIRPLRANIPVDFGLLLRFDRRRTREILTDEVARTAPQTYAEVRKEMEANIKRLAETNPIIVETNLKLQTAFKAEQMKDQFFQNLFGNQVFNFPVNPTGPDGKPLFSEIEFRAIKGAQAINQILTPAFNNLFQAIKAGENPLKAFFQGIGQQIEQLIQKLIAAAVQAAILSAIFPGGVGGVKGFGGFFKQILGFASGGIVSGPTLGLIGEASSTNRNNPEVVAPLDQLRGILGSLGSDSAPREMRARLRGNDLLLSSNRTGRTNRRLGAG